MGAGLRGIVLSDPTSYHEEVFFLNPPEAGNWKITVNAGSVPVSAVDTANQLPAPHGSGHVTMHGLKAQLNDDLHLDPGQSAELVEESADGDQHLGPIPAGMHTVNFTPAGIRSRPRTMVAIVTQHGLAAERVVLAH